MEERNYYTNGDVLCDTTNYILDLGFMMAEKAYICELGSSIGAS